MAALSDLIKKPGAAAPAAPPASSPEPAQRIPAASLPVGGQLYLPDPGGLVTGVEIEAVVGGALMRVAFGPGTNPAEVPAILRGFDANAKFRDDFPRGGFGGGGRNTKTARVLVINVDVREAGKFIDLTADGPDGAKKIAVGRKAVDEWLPKLEALGKLTPRNLTKVKNAFESKKAETIILSEAEQFGANYFEHEGKAFLDSMQADAPAVPAQAEGGAE